MQCYMRLLDEKAWGEHAVIHACVHACIPASRIDAACTHGPKLHRR